MTIGGPMWQKTQAAKHRGLGYGRAMREAQIEQRRASIQALGSKLFATNANAGAGLVTLSFQLAASRMQEAFQAKQSEINKKITGAGLGDKIDLLA